MLLLFGGGDAICQQTQIQLISRFDHFRELDAEVVLATLDSADQLAQKGDTLVLSELFNLSFKSDGYISEYVGTILGDLFLQKTEFFLNSLLNRTDDQQRQIATMAFYMDGSGMEPKDYDIIERKLKKIQMKEKDQLAHVAKICLSAMRHVKKELHD